MQWIVPNVLNVVLAADVGKKLNSAYRNEQTETNGSPSNTALPALGLLGPTPQTGTALAGPTEGQASGSAGSSTTAAVDTATRTESTTATAPKRVIEQDFEELRQETIARNKALMKELGLGSGLPEPKAAKKRKKREKPSASAAPTTRRKSQRNKPSNEPSRNADGTSSSEPPSTTTASSPTTVSTTPQPEASVPVTADKEAPADCEGVAPGGQLAPPRTTLQATASPEGSSTGEESSSATTVNTGVPPSTQNDAAPPSLSTPPTTSLDASESARVKDVGTHAQTTLLTGINSVSSDVVNSVNALKTVPAPRALSIDSPPRAPSVDVSSLYADDSAVPEWMMDALQYFKLIEGGEGWKQLLVEWLEFEKVSGYPNGQVRQLHAIYLFLCN